MQVKDLIKKLKKMDQEAIVIWQDHDHSMDELNGTVDWVLEVDSEALIDRFRGPVVALRG